MTIDARLRAAGVPRAITTLWFAKAIAAEGAVIFAVAAAGGVWLMLSFHANPDQIVESRYAWESAGHGTGGFLFGLVVAGGGIVLSAGAAWRLATRRSAFEITSLGVLTEQPFVGRRLWAWNRIECVKVERHYVASRIPFVKPRLSARLVLYLQGDAGRAARAVRLEVKFIKGGLSRTCRFADTLDRALEMARAGAI